MQVIDFMGNPLAVRLITRVRLIARILLAHVSYLALTEGLIEGDLMPEVKRLPGYLGHSDRWSLNASEVLGMK